MRVTVKPGATIYVKTCPDCGNKPRIHADHGCPNWQPADPSKPSHRWSDGRVPADGYITDNSNVTDF